MEWTFQHILISCQRDEALPFRIPTKKERSIAPLASFYYLIKGISPYKVTLGSPLDNPISYNKHQQGTNEYH